MIAIDAITIITILVFDISHKVGRALGSPSGDGAPGAVRVPPLTRFPYLH